VDPGGLIKGGEPMTYRDVLVHVKYNEAWSPHIDAAGVLAQSFGARLTGLYTLSDLAALKAAFGRSADSVREREHRDAAKATEAEEKFRAFLKQKNIVGDWKVGEGNAGDLLPWASRFCDLIVVEQTDLGTDEIGLESEIQTVMASGRPTLVVPKRGTFPTIGKRILLAWNGSREAATALHGALPLIEKADHVDILLGRGKEVFGSITRYPDLKITDYVARRARSFAAREIAAGEPDAGAAILKAANEAGSDLIVMGAFARSWFREWIFGGATLHVLRKTTLPVLMAH
jgi:nucleotide-binding universal stress UspA family protein